MVHVETIREAVRIAGSALWSAKLRSALTILGIVIGVSTVMTMASLVQGIRDQIINTIEAAGPTTFYVVRAQTQGLIQTGDPPAWIRMRPLVTEDEADRLAAIPEIDYAGIWIQTFQSAAYRGERTGLMVLWAADDRFMDQQGGTLVAGRFFTRAERRRGDPVIVIDEAVAGGLFGHLSPVGRYVDVGRRPVWVVGVYRQPENIFAPPGTELGGIVPYLFGKRSYRYDETQGQFIVVRPRAGIPLDRAQDLVTVTLRRMRGLRPSDENNFDLTTQEQILTTFNQLTSAFFLVMIALSSIALLVGGIGVMAIMMVSVTDRTNEIGLRKAMGATRGEILWQFLIEAATVTLVGGVIGVGIGLGVGELFKRVLHFSAAAPLWSAGVALLVSAMVGLVFGLYPANRAARLDPIDALRYE